MTGEGRESMTNQSTDYPPFAICVECDKEFLLSSGSKVDEGSTEVFCDDECMCVCLSEREEGPNG